MRKRVGKACDRCRNKKSKVCQALDYFTVSPCLLVAVCTASVSFTSILTDMYVLQCDGQLPCNRCCEDNMLCLFGERDKAHDKVWPKGTVELQQKALAVYETAILQLYQKTQMGYPWEGPPVPIGGDGRPLIHAILASLGTCNPNCPIFDQIKEEIVDHIEDGAQSKARKRAVNKDGKINVKVESHDAGPQSIPPTSQGNTQMSANTTPVSLQQASSPFSAERDLPALGPSKQRWSSTVRTSSSTSGGRQSCNIYAISDGTPYSEAQPGY